MAFEITSKSLRRVRWSARAPRLALTGGCAVLSALGLHSLTAPPESVVSPIRESSSADLQAEAVAEAFARAYISSEPGRRALIRRFAPALADDELGMAPTRSGVPVRWSAVTGDRVGTNGRRVTVLVETADSMVALVVPVVATSDGVSITGAPALVGVPPASRDHPVTDHDTVDDEQLTTTLTRTLRNFLGRRRDDLAADLDVGAVVVVPEQETGLHTVESVDWVSKERVVRAVLTAGLGLEDKGDVRLDYEVGVVRKAGRWLIRWIGAPKSTSGS